MSGPPEFSVIVPTYYEESSIEKTLSSLRRAALGYDVEIIVVDSGSRDRTVEIAGRYADHVSILKKRGIGYARNHGASIAQGRIFVFIDSDTTVPENFFKTLHDVFLDSSVAGANCNVMPSDDVNPTITERLFYSIWGALRSVFYRIRPCGTGDNGIIVRNEIFREVNGFDENMGTMEDLDFVFRASRHGRFVFIRELALTESMRRIRKTGIMKFTSIYIFNFIYYLVKGRPRISEWPPVR